MLVEIILILFFIMISGAVSGSETAFFSYNNPDVQKDSKFYNLISKPYKLLLLVLIINVFVNVGFTSVFEKFIIDTLKLNGIISFLTITFFLLIFGEIVPKALALNMPTVFIKVMTPVFTILKKPTDLMMNLFAFLENFFENIQGIIEPHSMDKSSLNSLMQYIFSESNISKKDSILLSSILNWDLTPITSFLTDFLEIPSGVDDKTLKLLSEGKIPFIISRNKKGEIDNFVFYKNGKFLNLEKNQTVSSQKSCYFTINKILKQNFDFLIIVDEYGTYHGYIEKNKFINSLFADFAERENNTAPKTIQTSALSLVTDINRNYYLRLSMGNYSTLNGYILENLGRIPNIKESFFIEGLKFTILKSEKNLLKEIKIESGVENV